MNHKDFGQLVAALRREHRYLDKDSKVRFWSQERLAEVANLSEDTIIKIEGGRKRNLSPDILLKLAQALNLTTEERVEFFMAANDLDDRQIIRCPDNPHDTLQHLVQTLQQTYLPAFIIDTYCDVLAVNEAVLMIFNVSDNGCCIHQATPDRNKYAHLCLFARVKPARSDETPRLGNLCLLEPDVFSYKHLTLPRYALLQGALLGTLPMETLSTLLGRNFLSRTRL